MPLHDWSKSDAWEGVHHIWISELFRCIKPQLPAGYRAHIGSVPTLAIGANGGKPDVSVRSWLPNGSTSTPEASESGEKPDGEVALKTVAPDTALLVERGGFLVAAIELVSPANKDRPASREVYQARYLGYIKTACNLLLIDLHPKPRGYSFFELIGKELELPGVDPQPPAAVSYRVGEPTPDGGRFVAYWRRPLKVAQPLPNVPLALNVFEQVTIEMESTYAQAARDAYLD